jgi:hypothetical protein
MTLYNNHHHGGSNYNTSKPKDLTTPKIPRGLRSLAIASPASDSGLDRNQLQTDAALIEQWWADQRWNHTTRAYKGTS